MTKRPLDWTNTHIKLYNTLWNKWVIAHPDADYDTFLDKTTYRRMYNFIHADKVGDGSKKSTLFMIARYLEIRGNRNHQKYMDEAKRLRDLIDNQEQDNQQDDKEKEYYRDHDFLLNIVKKYDNEGEHTKPNPKFKKHMAELALAITVRQPPLRTNFMTSAKIIFQKQDDNKTDNFVFLNRSHKKIQYIVNDDKVSKTRSYANGKHSIIDIENKQLKDLIFWSVSQYPRTYLFQTNEGNTDKEMQGNTFNNMIRRETLSDKISNDMLRSSYITWYYNNHKTHNAREKLAKQMRHSVASASIYYFKDLPQKEITTEEVKDLAIENSLIQDKLEKCESTKLTDKEFRKRRYDILYSINRKGNVPKNSTIDKYNLVFNEETNQFE